jgi:hypothetical protein
VKQKTGHPAWAKWTWTQAWLPKTFHSGGDKPIWQWLRNGPYLPDRSAKGKPIAIDTIALGLGSLLHDIEAVQFIDEFQPPRHVAESQVGFNMIGSVIHPILDDFSKIVQDHNNGVSE